MNTKEIKSQQQLHEEACRRVFKIYVQTQEVISSKKVHGVIYSIVEIGETTLTFGISKNSSELVIYPSLPADEDDQIVLLWSLGFKKNHFSTADYKNMGVVIFKVMKLIEGIMGEYKKVVTLLGNRYPEYKLHHIV